MSNNVVVRRRDRRVWFWAAGIFVAVGLFTFLINNFKSTDSEVKAASLANFDPGYIISDYQMGNYNSMSEAEIQAFLTKKNPCGNRDRGYYDTLTAKYSGRYVWHWNNDHFVCLSEELFGDGEVIGSGETAAHIIWQAAQDYKINPQVLMVLLQKETSLITDPIPNNGDYRKATGYGCPDTAPCSSEYYGFKNQVRKAAELFSTVLRGGWTNYPLGNNYIQYNPNAGCGGSIVNIKNLATSALYRYTPYQPNAETLAAGYGTANCGAYGNRNFYLYFEDWFGGVKNGASYVKLEDPRYLRLKYVSDRINPYDNSVVDVLDKGMVRKYITKIELPSGEWCLRTEYSSTNGMNACVELHNLEEVSFIDFENPRYMRIINDADRINPYNGAYYDSLEGGRVLEYTTKIYANGEWYYRTKYMSNNNLDVAMSSKYLEEVEYLPFENPRYMKIKKDTFFVNPYTGEVDSVADVDELIKFNSKIYINNKWYYRSEEMTNKKADVVISSDNVDEMPSYQDFETPRKLKTIKAVERINPYTGEKYDSLIKNQELMYTTNIFINDEWFYRTEYMTNMEMDVVVPAWVLNEI